MCAYVCGIKLAGHPDIVYDRLPNARLLSSALVQASQSGQAQEFRLRAGRPPEIYAVSFNVCRWYKKKPVDSSVMNEGNTSASYNEQRLFLQAGSNRSCRLLGGSTFGGDNQIWAHKRGNKQAEMQF